MVSAKNDIKGLALLNEILGWDFGSKEQLVLLISVYHGLGGTRIGC